MALLVYNVTIGTNPVQAVTSNSAAPNHQPVKWLRIESEVSNALVYYGDKNVSSTNYAGTVIANTASVDNSVIIGPSQGTGQYAMNLDEFFFTGTNGQKIHITAIA